MNIGYHNPEMSDNYFFIGATHGTDRSTYTR